MSDTKVIVTTCVKDEGWILDRFLSTCSFFADYIIISDESSGLDNSLEIYKKYPKAIVHHNYGPSQQSDLRRRFVFDEARKIPCEKRIIVALDADEIISANIMESLEWQTVLNAEPGTLIFLQWVNLWMHTRQYKIDDPHYYGMYNRTIWVDDGVSTIPEVGIKGMHMVYTPMRAKKRIFLSEIVCLHYQFCNWQRMEAKHRFYRVYEKVTIKKLSDLGIYRMYNHMKSRRISTGLSPNNWFAGWQKLGIDMTSISTEEFFYYDLTVLDLIDKHGADAFALQDIWSADWEAIISRGKSMGCLPENYQLKRTKSSFFRRAFHFYMRHTIDVFFIRKLEKRFFKKGMSYLKWPV